MALTQVEVLSAVPTHLRSAITPEFVNKLNNIAADPLIAEEFEKNFISYSRVLMDGKFKTEDYLNAVNYVTYKLLGHTNQDAYAHTFPDRIRRMTAQGYDAKKISSFVSGYHKGQLVSAILQQAMIPAFVLHQSKFHEAIGVLAEIATDTNALNKDRVAAADSLVRNLTPPQAKEVNVNLGVQEASGMAELRAAMASMADQQRRFIENGGDVKLVAESVLIEGKATEVTQP
jgi:hypothetical protein